MRNPARVVIDTNVLVSRLLRIDSVPGQAVGKALHRDTVLVSHETMTELANVLAQAKFDRYVTIEQRLQFIRLMANTAEFVPIVHTVRECRDPKDDKFLEVALNGRADVIITGDVDLLRMHPWREIEILSPAAHLRQ
jgi:putative PIN family toxin of toxin-antitoxin system